MVLLAVFECILDNVVARIAVWLTITFDHRLCTSMSKFRQSNQSKMQDFGLSWEELVGTPLEESADDGLPKGRFRDTSFSVAERFLNNYMDNLKVKKPVRKRVLPRNKAVCGTKKKSGWKKKGGRWQSMGGSLH